MKPLEACLRALTMSVLPLISQTAHAQSPIDQYNRQQQQIQQQEAQFATAWRNAQFTATTQGSCAKRIDEAPNTRYLIDGRNNVFEVFTGFGFFGSKGTVRFVGPLGVTAYVSGDLTYIPGGGKDYNNLPSVVRIENIGGREVLVQYVTQYGQQVSRYLRACRDF